MGCGLRERNHSFVPVTPATPELHQSYHGEESLHRTREIKYGLQGSTLRGARCLDSVDSVDSCGGIGTATTITLTITISITYCSFFVPVSVTTAAAPTTINTQPSSLVRSITPLLPSRPVCFEGDARVRQTPQPVERSAHHHHHTPNTHLPIPSLLTIPTHQSDRSTNQPTN